MAGQKLYAGKELILPEWGKWAFLRILVKT
jgi:hypothetical protein